MKITRKIQVFGSIFFVIVSIIALHFLAWLRPVEETLRSFITPVSQSLYHISMKIDDKTITFRTEDELKQAYALAVQQLQIFQKETAEVALLRDENKELREQLHFFTETSFSHVGADVIGKNIDPIVRSIIINRGAKEGIMKGQSVIIGNGILVGKVAHAEEDTAVVILLNDTQSKVTATLLNKDRSLGVVEGGYGLSVQMNLIPQDATFSIGDQIVTSGLEPLVPRGLLIGSVEAIEKEAHQPFQRAVIAPTASLDHISSVSVLIQETKVL